MGWWLFSEPKRKTQSRLPRLKCDLSCICHERALGLAALAIQVLLGFQNQNGCRMAQEARDGSTLAK